MRVKTFHRILRLVSAVVLFFFVWTFGSVWEAAAFAATSQKTVVKAQTTDKLTAAAQKPEEKFERVLDSIRDNIGKAGAKASSGEDETAEINAIKAGGIDLDVLNEQLQAEFSKTEKRLKSANLPKAILDRHTAFVKNYENNLAQLKSELEDIDAAKTKADQKTKIEKVRLHLEQTKPPKKHIPLDPNNLPFKARKVTKTSAPRLTPDEYQRDFPKQRSQSKQKVAVNALSPAFLANAPKPKPVLLALNEYASDVPFSVGAQPSVPELAFNDSSPFLLAQAADTPPDDLAENGIDIEFTEAIKAKAQELGYNPVRIYEYVRNNIEFIPTYGSIQGADMCLQTKQCNDMDTASLLITLLRASNISARYVYGTIEVPIDKIKNWVGGFSDSTAALTLVASGGVPVAAGVSGGVITKARLEHVWVEAYVPYGPYSGRPSTLNPDKIWVPLDPSFKQYSYTEGIDLQAAVPFNAQTFANQIQYTATINETEGYVTGVDSNYIQTTMIDYQTQIQNYISQNMPNARTEDIIGKKEIKKQEFGILPVTLPYKVITVGTKYSEVQDNLRHKVIFEIQDSSVTGNSLSYTTSIPEIAGKRLTLSYAPATAADEQVINNYGGIFNVPAYLVNMKPQIKMEGVTMASGNSIGLGNQEIFNMKFVSPSGGADSVVSNSVTVGAYYGIGINPSKISKDLIDKRRTKLAAIQSPVDSSIIYTDDYIGELMYTTAIAYFFELDAFTDVIAKNCKIVDLKHVSEAIVSKELSVATLYGKPTNIADASIMVDVDRLIHSAVARNGNQTNERQFTITAGQMSSAMEHGIFEQLYQAKGVSTIQVLQLANSQGIPIYTITSSNISSVLPQLQISSELIMDIQNAVNAGKTVVIPQQYITYYGWTGVGFIVMDPVTGSGAYMISTSLAGGSECVAAGGLLAVFLSIISTTGAGGSHQCTALNIEHNVFINSLQTMLTIIAPLNLGALLIWAGATNSLATIALGMALSAQIALIGIGLILIAIAIFHAYLLYNALKDTASLQANNIFAGRAHGSKYNGLV